MNIHYSRNNDRNERTRGRRWMRLRHVVLVEQPVCMICGKRSSTEVDHIIPVTKGGTDERSNLQGTCSECHEDKTRNDLGLKNKPVKIGLDGYPIDDGKNILNSIVNLKIFIGLQCFITKVFPTTYGNRQPKYFFGKLGF